MRYSVRLFVDQNIDSIRKSIIRALPTIDFHTWGIIDDDEIYCSNFEISIDDGYSVCFYFNDVKLDKKYIHSIISPVIVQLNIPNDYSIYDYIDDEYIKNNLE